MIQDDTQVYITGVLYQSDAFPDNPYILFGIVDSAFREITNLDYKFLSINRAENRFSNSTTREQLLIFMKDVNYNGTYLTDTNSTNLRSDLITKLNSVTDLTYDDVEIRTTRIVI